MANHSFLAWLNNEVVTAKCALLLLYEKHDKLKYIDGPALDRLYMEQVGNFEQTVINEEIEVELLRTKQEMIQAAINRREPIDEEAIDAQLNDKRIEMMKQAQGEEIEGCAMLGGSATQELQKLYSDIVKNFHPQTHPDITEFEQELFAKAQEAYRHQDLSAMQLIHEMLFSTYIDIGGLEFATEILKSDEVENVLTDYKLVSVIYNSFVPTSEEASLQEEATRFRQEAKKVMEDIEEIEKTFPFTARGMLSDPEKIAEYKAELEHRLREAIQERERYTEIIREMIESVATNG